MQEFEEEERPRQIAALRMVTISKAAHRHTTQVISSSSSKLHMDSNRTASNRHTAKSRRLTAKEDTAALLPAHSCRKKARKAVSSASYSVKQVARVGRMVAIRRNSSTMAGHRKVSTDMRHSKDIMATAATRTKRRPARRNRAWAWAVRRR